MNKKTAPEIETEISALLAVKEDVRALSLYGISHHLAIDAQVRTLTEEMTAGDVWDMEWDMYERDAALAARRWALGETEIAPSATWKDFPL